jgi:dTDP-4-amino-4,6-dideoxygalactose transaminase
MSCDPYEVVRKFENEITQYAGAKYGIMVNSCTNAIFLCCKYLKVKTVYLPKFTYPGVACSVINAGGKIIFRNLPWYGRYFLEPYYIYDSALRFTRGMYVKDSLYCLSFHYKKHLPIGHGGMILCNNEKTYLWLKKMSFDGRTEGVPLSKDKLNMVGWHMNVTPEQAARGLMLFHLIKNKELPDLEVAAQGYPDLSKIAIYNQKGR